MMPERSVFRDVLAFDLKLSLRGGEFPRECCGIQGWTTATMSTTSLRMDCDP